MVKLGYIRVDIYDQDDFLGACRPASSGAERGTDQNFMRVRSGVGCMRKVQQKRILELLQTLREANDDLKQLLSKGEHDSAIQLLGDCQEFAVSVGNYIEELEGEGTQTISLLGEYCKFLYDISLEVRSGNETTRNLTKPLNRQLIQIENSVRDELKPNKTEMVFFPYKASMWDSLEPIWLAAAADPDCDAYVVPIPYYDKNLDGTLGQMHYEGDMYPENVPVTRWQEYDVAARRPDAIFIHSPYDDGNYVTSIHPDYYSQRLKEITDLLVYVPYFVVINDVEPHFCTCSGVLNADRVIVQSERIRQTYIRVIREFEQANQCKGLFGKTEEKFLALGSPKFDKVLNSKPEDFTLPEDWERMITKPDGGRKKVVLYTTSIGALLEGNEKYIEKLQSMLDVFRAQDDIVLWWRPHPLIEATLRSMRPQLFLEYNKVVARYRTGQ